MPIIEPCQYITYISWFHKFRSNSCIFKVDYISKKPGITKIMFLEHVCHNLNVPLVQFKSLLNHFAHDKLSYVLTRIKRGFVEKKFPIQYLVFVRMKWKSVDQMIGISQVQSLATPFTSEILWESIKMYVLTQSIPALLQECLLFKGHTRILGCPKISQGLGRNSFRPPVLFWGTID